MQLTIRDFLWELPEACYNDAMCEEKSAAVYQRVYEQYWEAGESVYVQVEWADTQSNLATSYYDRIRGDRAGNIERAIEHGQIVSDA